MRWCLAALLLFFGFITTLHSATFTVTTTQDGVAGSLRQAINNANATPGPDSIVFNIPGTGLHTIFPTNSLPQITAPVIIDGYSQPGSSPNTLANGNNAVLRIVLDGVNAQFGVGLQIVTSNSVVRGLVINRFNFYGIDIRGRNNVVEGNFLGTDPPGIRALPNGSYGVVVFNGIGNLIGGATPSARNLISGNSANGVRLFNAVSNRVEGNYIGTDVTGTGALPNLAVGVDISGGGANIVGGAASGTRNIISGNSAAGVSLNDGSEQFTFNNVVQGNFIGLERSGATVVPNGVGVIMSGGFNNFIIGNVISGNSNGGLLIQFASGNLVQGNLIGTDAAGVNPRGNGIGVDFGNSGLSSAILGNVIWFNGTGIRLQSLAGTNNVISSNSISGNTGLGIDIGGNGPTPNDVNDPDAGPNNTQNFPLPTNAITTGSSINIRGTLQTQPNVAARIEFFSNAQCDSSGFGEGATFLGAFNGTTDGGGNLNFNATFSASVPLGQVITATATVAGNTSEFSPCVTVRQAPTIVSQPASQTVTNGGTASFSVAVTGTTPLSYQWRFNGANISGATSPTLTIPNASPAQQGNYTVVITNIVGAVTSSVATLTVLVPPAITVQPSSRTVTNGNSVTFAVVASGTSPLTFQWRFNGGNIASATDPSFTINSAAPGNEGNYTVVVSNGAGSITSAVATLTVLVPPTITTQPSSQTLVSGGTANFSVVASGTLPFSYQWRFNGASLAGQTGPTLTINNVNPTNQGNYTVVIANSAGAVTSAVATLTVLVPPTITSQPSSLVVASGGTASFEVVATGTTPLTYQWRFNGANLPGQTGASLTISGATPTNAGNYTVVVANSIGSVTSSVATLTVVVAPTITSQPQSQTLFAGGAAMFSVTAVGTAPLTYQWLFNGSNLPGETGASLTIQNISAANQGNYTVIVANNLGSVTSAVATLTVVLPAVITSQPVSQTVFAGGRATFSVSATGTAPLTYQWRFNGANLPGETGPILAIDNAGPSNEGGYTVVVANSGGSVTSAVATLTVLAAPVITTQPANQTAVSGSSATFTVTATGAAPLSYQWRFNGSNLSGETAPTLTINGVTPANEGGYSVIVANSAGSVTSVVAALTVLVPPAITTQPASQTIASGGSATFTVVATGTAPLTYQWRFNGANLPGETGASLTINNATPANQGAYTVVINNTAGTVTSAEAFLAVLVLPDLKLAVSVSPAPPLVETLVTYNITVFGTVPTTVTGLRLTNELPAHTLFAGVLSDRGLCTLVNGVVVCDLGNIDQGALPLNVSIDVVPQVPGVMVNRTTVAGAEADANPADNVAVSSTTVFPPTPPVIVQQPADQSVAPGSTVVLQVVAVPSPLSYQWQRNGVNLPGETSDLLVLPNVSAADGGGYSVVVANRYDAVNSRQATVRIISPPLPFSDDFQNAGLLTQPSGFGSGSNVGATRQPGEPQHAGKRGGSSVWVHWLAPAAGIVTFSTDGSTFDTVLAAYVGQTVGNLGELASDDDSGSFNNSKITFSVSAGTIYRIAIDGFARGQGDIVLSWQFEQTLDPRPFILGQPTNQVVRPGERAEFNVSGGVDAIGQTLEYQWYFENQPIPGANQESLVIPAAALENVGRYFVRLTVNNRFLDSRAVFLQLIDGATTDAGLASGKFADVVDDAIGDPTGGGAVAAKNRRTKAVAKGFTATQIFSTIGSTKEPGEPNHCGVIGGASYWFAYQAPGNGSLIMNTDGSLFDTVLAVYTGPGDDFATLVPVACDNNGGADGLDSRARFSVTTGTIYWIAVDGVGGTSGKVTLNWNFFPELRAPTHTPGGFRFTVAGKTNVNFTIQASTNMIDWQPLLRTNSTTGLYQFIDTNSSGFSNRFYRTLHDQ